MLRFVLQAISNVCSTLVYICPHAAPTSLAPTSLLPSSILTCTITYTKPTRQLTVPPTVFYFPTSPCRQVGCLETQGSCDGLGKLRKGLWKPQKKKRGEGKSSEPFAFALLSRKGCWKSELATSSSLMTPGLKPVTSGAWVTSWGWLQSSPHPLWPLGTGSTPKATAAYRAAPQVFCTLAPGSSATPPRPSPLENAALFHAIPHPVLSLQC